MMDENTRDWASESYEAAVENATEGIVVLDREGQIEFASQRVFGASGTSRDELIGRNISELRARGVLSSDEIAEVQAGIMRILQDGREEVCLNLRPDLPHERRILELRLTPFPAAARGDYVLGVLRDVTHRQELINRLKEVQRRTHRLMQTQTIEETARVAIETARNVLDASISGFHLVSEDGQSLVPIAFVDAARDDFDDPPTYTRPATSDTPSGVVWETFEAGEKRVIDDTRQYGRLAEETPARSAIIHPLGDHGVFIVSRVEPNGFLETDKTLVEILAVALTNALDRVEREQELRQQNQQLDEFASIISHDLRNPLTVAQARLELAQDEVDSEHLEGVERAHDRIHALIDDLLTLSREGKAIAETEWVDLTKLTTRSWNNIEENSATLVTESENKIRADSSRLQQLLENLMRNAIEHGGEDVTVTIGDLEDGSGFYVADDGPGIPPADRDLIFESGYSTREAGTGFGLSIVSQIVEAHGWAIDVTDSEKGGARFEIRDVDVRE